MAASGKGAVVAAVVGNGVSTVSKFVAVAMSGSGSMFSEGVHSLTDTANRALPLVGIKSSERAADAMVPYGYGGDRYGLTAELEFDGAYLGAKLKGFVGERASTLTTLEAYDAFAAELDQQLLDDEVDSIEQDFREKFPAVRYVALEADSIQALSGIV